MIPRVLSGKLLSSAGGFPAVTVTGPRQSGKSTLCRALFPHLQYVNLESPDVRRFALEDPRAFLAQHATGAILDEVQRTPELPSYLQPMIDERPAPGRWILTGSQNFALVESVSQSLAGRTAMLNLLPLTWDEIRLFEKHPRTVDEVMLAGGYPRIHDLALDPADWLAAYVATYVERDVRSISAVGDLLAFQRFLGLCAGRTGQLLNYSGLATDAGITQPTAKAWFSILEASFIAFRLPAWSGYIRKRLVKMPKLHFYDSGLACWLLGIRTAEQLRSHPLRGSIFETWVVSEILKTRANAGERGGLYFYRDQNGVEADVLLETGNGLQVIEVKAGQTVTADLLSSARRSHEVLQGLATATPVVVYAGDERQRRTAAELIPWHSLGEAGLG